MLRLQARQAALLLAAAAVLSVPSTGEGREPLSPTSDRVIYGQGTALWSIPSTGGETTLLANLPGPASQVSDIEVAASGTAMLLRIRKHMAWADLSLGAKLPVLRFLPCPGGDNNHSDLSPDGNRVICETRDGGSIAIYTLRPSLRVQIIQRPALGPVLFLGASGDAAGFGTTGGLADLSRGVTLSPHRPTRSWIITPDGKRALGDYDESGIDVVYTFRLDGRATKRTLMQAARVVSVSADSKWASLQQEMDACAVRISGGQYMCWRRYQAMDISSKARSFLLSRVGSETGHDLFVGSVSGTQARKPRLLVPNIESKAVFWSVPGRF